MQQQACCPTEKSCIAPAFGLQNHKPCAILLLTTRTHENLVLGKRHTITIIMIMIICIFELSQDLLVSSYDLASQPVLYLALPLARHRQSQSNPQTPRSSSALLHTMKPYIRHAVAKNTPCPALPCPNPKQTRLTTTTRLLQSYEPPIQTPH